MPKFILKNSSVRSTEAQVVALYAMRQAMPAVQETFLEGGNWRKGVHIVHNPEAGTITITIGGKI